MESAITLRGLRLRAMFRPVSVICPPSRKPRFPSHNRLQAFSPEASNSAEPCRNKLEKLVGHVDFPGDLHSTALLQATAVYLLLSSFIRLLCRTSLLVVVPVLGRRVAILEVGL